MKSYLFAFCFFICIYGNTQNFTSRNTHELAKENFIKNSLTNNLTGRGFLVDSSKRKHKYIIRNQIKGSTSFSNYTSKFIKSRFVSYKWTSVNINTQWFKMGYAIGKMLQVENNIIMQKMEKIHHLCNYLPALKLAL